MSNQVEAELQDIVDEALHLHAASVHFTSRAAAYLVRLRMGRTLVPSLRHPSVGTAVVAQLMRGAELDHGTGASRAIEAGGVRWRLTATETAGGPHVLLHRVLAGPAPLTQLGLGAFQLGGVLTELGRTGGLTVIAGPPGAGKTSTFYAALSSLDRDAHNVVTLEDPIEQRLDGVVQREWPRAGTVCEIERSLARQDPDVIGFGIIDDPTTARLAIGCALGGTKVVAAMVVARASQVPSRLLMLGIEPFLITSVLRQVVCQRVVRLSCPLCLVDDALGADRLDELGDTADRTALPRRGAGCDRCDRTGLAGVTGMFEVMNYPRDIHELILQGASAEELESGAVQGGMITLRHRAATLVAHHVLSVAEALRALG